MGAARAPVPAGAGGLTRVAIVGAGLAGLRAAEALRAAGFTGRIDVVGAEREPPYTRPPLSKAVLTGDTQPGDCRLRGADALDARWHLGRAARALDLEARELTLADGARLPFDGLVLTTGAHARHWRGDTPPQVRTLRDLDDARHLRDALAAGPRRLLVVGAGFIGSEVSSSAAARGVAVTLVEVEPHPLARLLGPEVGALVEATHRAHGVDLRAGVTVECFETTDGALVGARLSDGAPVAADLCLLALGAAPATAWLAGSGVSLAGGAIDCEPDLRVRGADGGPLDGVVAAGDAVRWPHPLLGGEPLTVGHWTNAAEQGTHAARTLLATTRDGAPAGEPFAEVPTFWSAIHDLRLRSVGVPALGDRVRVLEGDLAERRCVLGYTRCGHLVGALAVNLNRRANAYRDRIGQPLDPASLAVEAG